MNLGYLEDIPGGDMLSNLFCNLPVRALSTWNEDDQAIAIVLLCGKLQGHEDPCDPIPPIEDIL